LLHPDFPEDQKATIGHIESQRSALDDSFNKMYVRLIEAKFIQQQIAELKRTEGYLDPAELLRREEDLKARCKSYDTHFLHHSMHEHYVPKSAVLVTGRL
jgi:hypothetical protein